MATTTEVLPTQTIRLQDLNDVGAAEPAEQPTNSLVQNNQSKEGFRASLVVVAAFLSIFTGCGINFAFGVYQELYESMSVSPEQNPFTGASPAQIDLIGTLAVSLMSLGGPFASGWCKSYSPRAITFAGALIFTLANVLASFCQSLWQFILTQGVILGCGTCLTYITAVTVTPGWFTKHRGLAIGIVSSGTGVGGVVWAPALRALNDHIGYRNTLRVTAAVSFVLLGAASIMMDWDPQSKQRNRLQYGSGSPGRRFLVPLVNWRVAKSRKFVAQCCSAGLQAAAYYAPVYFMSAYARTLGYSSASGAAVIALSNGASAAGKVIIGHLADRAGRINVLLVATFISAIGTLGLWLPSTLSAGDVAGRPLFITFAIIYGIFAGAYISLFPTALVEIFGAQHFASVNGFLYMVRGFAALFGTPIAGLLIRTGAGNAVQVSHQYLNTSVLIGMLLVGAALGVTWVRIETFIDMKSSRDQRGGSIWRA